MQLTELAGRRVAVWGTGREGLAAIAAIAPVGPASLIAVQDKPTFLAASAWDGPVPLYEGEAFGPALDGVEVLVRSPGIGESNPWIQRLRERGVTITGGTALWMADHAKHTIGVTGSKGKSTTTTLISHLLTVTGRPNELGGNIGIAVLSLPPAQRYVLELSMYQCADLQNSPRISVVTSLFEEHLDWTRDGRPAQYYAHKLNIAMHGPEAVVYNATDPTLSAELATRPGLPLVPVEPWDSDGWIVRHGERLFPRDAFALRGRHNTGNLSVALATLEAYGVDVIAERSSIEAGLRSYVPLPHRLTPIPDPSGVEFVNDSLSTAPQTTIHAIEAYAGRELAVLIGGQDRGIDYTPLRDYLRDREVPVTLIAIPDSGEHILDVVGDLPNVRRETATDLFAGVLRARALIPPGGVVLLSPAAPSYGRYDNYEARAKAFIAAIEQTATQP
ncbi:UDP-N-acetylmuramoyl-L-alanine--D-glutamate ligase [Dactylosporangium matsuzakiense]|uniref:UDP-N-acetylmuramoylalanine--D-glutamate ligase n=1 Tax=Dactylosporangium matsuzakiense TaxID=53360 RepID=A0A9W6KJH6_9ACTN|nr:UDP-N-acetylmuramoyl-L-alanine--D-glutamate ligase [Dactylosporangium matsuzakiense]UWZ47343.1 UDP-N-acetylmuramoyl-L-alanine--D-glutamate ligase [Dactylosporangium matsuzakiense]GLL01401.1 UDP-N-acetylmuramoylalanine--D-glutamate ligase [Dactylosporangium matsuzakiense]